MYVVSVMQHWGAPAQQSILCQSSLKTFANRNESSFRCRRAAYDRCLKCCHLSTSAGGACSEGIAAPC